MSSSIDDTSCPNCGGAARTETDHDTGETNTWCDDGCGFESINGEVVSEGSEAMAFVPDDEDGYYDDNDEGEF
jgi:hypothetical protein